MCMIETVSYPAWWGGATAVQVTYVGGGNSGSLDREDVEMLPQGVSWASGTLVPWTAVASIEKLS